MELFEYEGFKFDMQRIVEKTCENCLPQLSTSDLYDIVSLAFRGSGLEFDFDNKTGNFIIPIIDKIVIRGEWNDQEIYQSRSCYYEFSVEVDGFVGKDEQTGYVSVITESSPEAIIRYIPLFISIRDNLVSFAKPMFDEIGKGTDILSLVKSELDAANITDITMYPVKERDRNSTTRQVVGDEYKLYKEIMPGMRLSIIINPDDYKTTSLRFIRAWEQIPPLFANPLINKSLAYMYMPWDRSNNKPKYNWLEVSEHIHYESMTFENEDYPTIIPKELDEIIPRLNDMGFRYTIEGKILKVSVNKHITLCRAGKKTWFVTRIKSSNSLNVTTEEFILALRIIARASSVNGFSINHSDMIGFEIFPNFYSILVPALLDFLPEEASWDFRGADYGKLGIKYGTGFAIFVKQGSMLRVLWLIMSNLESIDALYQINKHGKKYPQIDMFSGDYRHPECGGGWYAIS